MFRDRRDAGRRLAARLGRYAGRTDLLVLGLPRGGVPVAAEVADALGAPLDVFVVRKLGVPGHEELAMGAIASGGVRVRNEDVIRRLGIPERAIDRAAEAEGRELGRREGAYRGDRPPPDPRGKVVILVDDGLATGATMRAALRAVRRLGPERVVVAVPVGAAVTCNGFTDVADEVVCATNPEPFLAVGYSYENFSPTTDDEVRELLASRLPTPAAGSGVLPPTEDRDMAAKPLSDLMFDWLTVLQNKAEGVAAYERYLKDAEAAGSAECVAMFRKLHERDTALLEEVKAHVFGMIKGGKAGA